MIYRREEGREGGGREGGGGEGREGWIIVNASVPTQGGIHL